MEEKPFDTEEELEILAELGEEGGGLDEEESEMIKSIIKFDDKTVREIMTPRVDIHGLSTTSTLDDVMDLIAKKQFSKIPIYKDTIDEIVCILYAKDVVPYLLGSRDGINLTSISRDAYFVPEQKPIDDLLSDFKKKKTSLAIVVDEWGGTSGLVTLEDIVEEVMGEIRDPFDIEKIPIEKTEEGSFIVDGKISIYDLEEEIEDINFPEKRDYDTLGGLILDRLENIPAEERDQIPGANDALAIAQDKSVGGGDIPRARENGVFRLLEDYIAEQGSVEGDVEQLKMYGKILNLTKQE